MILKKCRALLEKAYGGKRVTSIFRPMSAAIFFLCVILYFASCGGEAEPGATPMPSAPQTAPGAPALPTESSAPRFAAGCFVNGVDIAALTREQAAQRLERTAEDLVSGYRCVLCLGERRFVLGEDELAPRAELDETLEAALSGGSGSYTLQALPTRNEKLEAAVRAIAREVDSQPQNAELMTLRAFREAFADAEPGNAPQPLAENARFAVTAPSDGVRLDTERTLELILSGVKQAELPVETAKADGAVPELPERLAVFSTSFASPSLSAENRVFNIKKACALLDGRSIAPGESLSVNSALGERTREAGWLPAAAFANAGMETALAPGGGICQVSTTLYNCALLADLTVTERHGHSRRVAYAEGGRDAALNWGTSDLVILNGGARRVYLFMWADEDEQRLYCELYGSPENRDYDEIRIVSEFVSIIEPGEPVFTADPSLASGECVLRSKAHNGSVYRTVRVYLSRGAELRREPIAETTYLPRPAVYAASPGEQTNG